MVHLLAVRIILRRFDKRISLQSTPPQDSKGVDDSTDYDGMVFVCNHRLVPQTSSIRGPTKATELLESLPTYGYRMTWSRSVLEKEVKVRESAKEDVESLLDRDETRDSFLAIYGSERG